MSTSARQDRIPPRKPSSPPRAGLILRLGNWTPAVLAAVLAAAWTLCAWPMQAGTTNAPDPEITVQPTGGVAAAGEAFSFSTDVMGTTPFTFQWHFVRFTGPGEPFEEVALEGETNATLTLTNLQLSQTGIYYVAVTNALGGLLSQIAFLDVRGLILSQPRGGLAGLGEMFRFAVQTRGPGPFSYQWLFQDQPLADQTNATLTLGNLTAAQSGFYAVMVSNLLATNQTTNANLSVTAEAPRDLLLGTIGGTPSQATVPVDLVANGVENAISFSVRYDTNVLENPTFVSSVSNAVVIPDTSQSSNGLIGVTILLTAIDTFQPGSQPLGQLVFQVRNGQEMLQGGLAWTNQPVPIAATDLGSLPLWLAVRQVPSLQVLTPTPAMNLQSGLWEQKIELRHSGAEPLAMLNVGVTDLGLDTRTNAIRLFNRKFNTAIDSDRDGLDDKPADVVQIQALGPGETLVLTMEYYVADHLTPPHPTYLLVFETDRVVIPPAGGTLLSVTAARFVDGVFIIQFPTQTGFSYYVQYAPSPEELANPATVRTAFPAIVGTGGTVQWIDNGPPKTESPPVDGMRVYRLLRAQ